MTNDKMVVDLMRKIIELEKEYIYGKTKQKLNKTDKISEIKKIIENSVTIEGEGR